MDITSAIHLAIDNIQKDGLTDVDVFTTPFELSMIKGDLREKIAQEIKESLNHNSLQSLKVSPITHILFPKKELFDFRKCAHIQPLDEMKYLSLVLQLAIKIENMRICKDKKYIFSYRFNPQKGNLFDSNYNYTSFREHVAKKSKQKNINVMVSCDISNFYDRLNLHRLESILTSLPETNKKVVKQINELLLFWSNRDSYGLPVGSNASRILAEAALIEVDNYLISKKVDFCRFVDDYRFFASDAAIAHHWLSLLVDRLNKEGFFINTSKTEIKDVSNADHDEVIILFRRPPSEMATSENKQQKLFVATTSTSISMPMPMPMPPPVSAPAQSAETQKDQTDTEDLPSNQNISKIIRGYSGLIPTKFRKLTLNEVNKSTNINIQLLLEETTNSMVVDPKKFIQLIKVSIAQKKFHILSNVVSILNKFPQFIPYTLDAIAKNENDISDETIAEISKKLGKWLTDWNSSEFILVYIVRFFGRGRFTNKEILFEYFRSLRRNEGSYIGRAVLEQLEPLVNRGEVLEIRDYYSRADLWEKRQIAKMVDIHIAKEEKKAFFKNILSLENDIFIKNISGSFGQDSQTIEQ